jgi:hypothetical protein
MNFCWLAFCGAITLGPVVGYSNAMPGADVLNGTFLRFATAARVLSVAVQVSNYDGVPAQVLARAKADVTQVYRDIGVDVIWIDRVTSTADRFTIHIIIGHSAPGNVLGTTVGIDHPTGGTAFVYRDRVLQLARGRDFLVQRILAYAIAHEMGHLLLPYPAHADGGIMRAEWNDADIAQIAAGSLRFTSAEAGRMRDKISACCDAPTTTRRG